MKRGQSGVALIFALGILTLLLVMGVTFVSNMVGENRMTEDFVRSLRARLASQAGVERAVAELKQHARTTVTDSAGETWTWTPTRLSYDTLSGISGTLADGSQYLLRITDGNSRIDINVPVRPVAGSNLIRMLQLLPGLDAASAIAMITYRNTLPGRKFVTRQQVMLSGINADAYAQFRDFVTLHSYADPNASQDSGQVTAGTATTLKDATKSWFPDVYQDADLWIFAGTGKGQKRRISSNTSDTLTVDKAWGQTPDVQSSYAILARAPINVNTATDTVLSAVLTPVGGEGFIAGLKAARPIGSWKQFDGIVTSATVRNNANPNRPTPASATTEFCFNGGGIFEIESSGRVVSASPTRILSEQKTLSTVQIYKIWCESQKWQWARTPEFYRVTWLDTCPTDLSGDTGIDFPSSYANAVNALKIGYWDNFTEDTNYTQTMWATNVSGGDGTAGFDLTGRHMQFTNPGGLGRNRFPEFVLAYKQGAAASNPNSEDSWNFNDFYVRVTNHDEEAHFSDPFVGEGDVGRIRFRSAHRQDPSTTPPTPRSLASYYAYARNGGLKYVEDLDSSEDPRPFVQEYIFEITTDDGSGGRTGTGTYRETGTKYTGRKFGSSFGVVQDLDGVPMKMSTGQAEAIGDQEGEPKPPDPGPGEKPDPTDFTYYVKFISKAVFILADSGPDMVHGETDASGNYYPYYLYPYTYTIPGSVRKAYRLLGRDVRNTAGKAQAVSMQVQDSLGAQDFPGGTLGDGEIDTFIRRAGLVGLMGNANLPWWDDIRIISPDGNLRSAVLDAEQNAAVGTISWTNSAADESNEAISVDVRACGFANMTTDGSTPVSWSYTPTVVAKPSPEPPEIVRNVATGEITVAGVSAGNQSGRYLQYRVYLETKRPHSGSPGDNYLKETPVLEDITITYLPRAEVLSSK